MYLIQLGAERAGKANEGDLIEVFNLLQQEKEARVLGGFPSSLEQSLLTGQEGLFRDINTRCEEHKTNKKRLQTLSAKLMATTGFAVEELFVKGQEAAINSKLQELQAAIELAVVSINRRKDAISKMSGNIKFYGCVFWFFLVEV